MIHKRTIGTRGNIPQPKNSKQTLCEENRKNSMGKRQFEWEYMISSSVNIVTKGWYICMDSNRGCVSSWKLTQVLGSGYSPQGMVVHIVEVGPDS